MYNTDVASNSSYGLSPILLRRIWGSHGGKYEDGCLLGCSTVYTGISSPTFQRYVLPPPSGRRVALMMEAVRNSETLVCLYQCTRRCNPEDSHLRYHYTNFY
jgi:hypothetical protein